MTPEDLDDLKRLEATGGRTDRGFAQYNGELLRHAPALIAAAERCEQLEAENTRLCTQCEAVGLDMQRLELQLAEALEQLRRQTKSLCTHCGKFFPKGKEGVRQFREHIAECNKHPLQPLAAENARLREIVARLPATADGVPVVPGDTLYADLGEGCVEPVTMLGVRKCGVYTGCYSTREAAEAAKETA